MNLYWIIVGREYNYFTIASSLEAAIRIGQTRLNKPCTAERVKDRHYVVGATYLMDNFS